MKTTFTAAVLLLLVTNSPALLQCTTREQVDLLQKHARILENARSTAAPLLHRAYGNVVLQLNTPTERQSLGLVGLAAELAEDTVYESRRRHPCHNSQRSAIGNSNRTSAAVHLISALTMKHVYSEDQLAPGTIPTGDDDQAAPTIGSSFVFVFSVDDHFVRVVVGQGFHQELFVAGYTTHSENPLGVGSTATVAVMEPSVSFKQLAPSAVDSLDPLAAAGTEEDAATFPRHPASHWRRPLRIVSYNAWNTNPPRWLWRDPPERLRQYALRMLALGEVLRSTQCGANEACAQTAGLGVSSSSSSDEEEGGAGFARGRTEYGGNELLPDIIAFQEVRYDSSLGGWDSASPPSPQHAEGEAASGPGGDGEGSGSPRTLASLAGVRKRAMERRARGAADSDTCAAAAMHAQPTTGGGDLSPVASLGEGAANLAVPNSPPAPGVDAPPPGRFGQELHVAQDWFVRMLEFGATDKHGKRNEKKWKRVVGSGRHCGASRTHPFESCDGTTGKGAAATATTTAAAASAPAPAAAAGMAEGDVSARGEVTSITPGAQGMTSAGTKGPGHAGARAPSPPYEGRRATPAVDAHSLIQAVELSPHSQLTHLSALLPEFQYVATPAHLYLDPGSYWGEPSRDEEGPAIFSRHPIIHHDHLLLSRDPSDEGDGHQRAVLHAVIDVTGAVGQEGTDAAGQEGAGSGGGPSPAAAPRRLLVDVYTVHLSLSEAARNRTVPEMLAFIAATARGDLLLLTGDMNAEPHEPAMRWLVTPRPPHSPPAPLQAQVRGVGVGDPDMRGSELSDPLSGPTTREGESDAAPEVALGAHRRLLPHLHDMWRAVHDEPEPRSPDPAVQRYGLTFPSDAPTKRIDFILGGIAGSPRGPLQGEGRTRTCTSSDAWCGVSGEVDDMSASPWSTSGGGSGRGDSRKGRDVQGALEEGPRSTQEETSCLCVSRAFLLGQDALPATEGYEGRGIGMTSDRSPVYASDHRAVVVDISL